MGLTTTNVTQNCFNCDLPLPLRQPLPGEAGSTWHCTYCNAVFHAVLVESSPPDVLANVRPAHDTNPRMLLGDQTLASMYKRRGKPGRVFNERQLERKETGAALTILIEGDPLAVQAVDLSAGGFGFISPKPFEPETTIAVCFDSLPGQPTAEGKVMSCAPVEDQCFRIGVQFTPRSDDFPEPSDTPTDASTTNETPQKPMDRNP